jgi:hypothetical protein
LSRKTGVSGAFQFGFAAANFPGDIAFGAIVADILAAAQVQLIRELYKATLGTGLSLP